MLDDIKILTIIAVNRAGKAYMFQVFQGQPYIGASYQITFLLVCFKAWRSDCSERVNQRHYYNCLNITPFNRRPQRSQGVPTLPLLCGGRPLFQRPSKEIPTLLLTHKSTPGDTNTPVNTAERLTLIQRQALPLVQNLSLIQLQTDTAHRGFPLRQTNSKGQFKSLSLFMQQQ